jgi:hypothetical protein
MVRLIQRCFALDGAARQTFVRQGHSLEVFHGGAPTEFHKRTVHTH